MNSCDGSDYCLLKMLTRPSPDMSTSLHPFAHHDLVVTHPLRRRGDGPPVTSVYVAHDRVRLVAVDLALESSADLLVGESSVDLALALALAHQVHIVSPPRRRTPHVSYHLIGESHRLECKAMRSVVAIIVSCFLSGAAPEGAVHEAKDIGAFAGHPTYVFFVIVRWTRAIICWVHREGHQGGWHSDGGSRGVTDNRQSLSR